MVIVLDVLRVAQLERSSLLMSPSEVDLRIYEGGD